MAKLKPTQNRRPNRRPVASYERWNRPGNRGGSPEFGSMPVQPKPEGFDYEAFNAWQDPSIGGQQPGPIQQGWGGFGNINDTMLKTKMNNYLNQQAVGGARETMMNQLGYFNQGNPYTPQVGAGVNRALRGRARGNQKSGGYSAPGIYQHQDARSFETDEQGNPNMNFGGYTGFTTVGDDLSAKYTPFARNRMPHNQIGQVGKGTGANRKPPWGRDQTRGYNDGPGFQPGGGRTRPGGGGGGGGVAPGGRQPGGGGGGGGGGRFANKPRPGAFPALPPKPPNFLPMTPGFEADYRQANDAMAGAEGAYAASGVMLPAQIQQQQARLDTDRSVATSRLKEQLAGRGVYTPWSGGSTAQNPQRASMPAGGGIGQSLYGREVATPFGRAYQDLAAQGAGAYQDRALGYGGAQLGFNQQMMDALLQRANDAYSAMPLSLPIGGYDLPQMAGPTFSTNAGRTRRPRGKGKGNRNRNRRR